MRCHENGHNIFNIDANHAHASKLKNKVFEFDILKHVISYAWNFWNDYISQSLLNMFLTQRCHYRVVCDPCRPQMFAAHRNSYTSFDKSI